MAETATYIYCLVERDRRPAMSRVPRGLAGAAPPELLEISKRLWSVVGEVPLKLYGPDRLDERLQDLAWVADVAVAHASVVEHFARANGSVVVPMTLFTMFSSRERAQADLRARSRELRAILQRIRGCDEWGVRITRAAVTAAPRRTGRISTASKTGSGAAFLEARKLARDEAREAVERAACAAEGAFETLSRLARSAGRRDAPAGAVVRPLLDAAFLVPSTRTARFRQAARRAAIECRAAGADLTLTGPWPAYNFVQNAGARG
jgi:hypothetical protein